MLRLEWTLHLATTDYPISDNKISYHSPHVPMLFVRGCECWSLEKVVCAVAFQNDFCAFMTTANLADCASYTAAHIGGQVFDNPVDYL